MIIKKTIFLYVVMLALSAVHNPIANAGDILIDTLPIISVPEVRGPDSESNKIIHFQGEGTIQRVGHDEEGNKLMVVDDRLLYLSDIVKYFDVNGVITPRLKFHEGIKIGYFYGKNRKLTEIHLTGE